MSFKKLIFEKVSHVYKQGQCFKVFHFRVCHTQVLAEGFFSHFRSCNLVNGFVYSSSLCSAVGISMQDKARHLFITFKLQLQLQYLVYEIEKKFVPVIAKKKKKRMEEMCATHKTTSSQFHENYYHQFFVCFSLKTRNQIVCIIGSCLLYL